MEAAAEYLEVAGCMRTVSSLADKQALLEDVVSFHLITRMQLPFQRCLTDPTCKLTLLRIWIVCRYWGYLLRCIFYEDSIYG